MKDIFTNALNENQDINSDYFKDLNISDLEETEDPEEWAESEEIEEEEIEEPRKEVKEKKDKLFLGDATPVENRLEKTEVQKKLLADKANKLILADSVKKEFEKVFTDQLEKIKKTQTKYILISFITGCAITYFLKRGR